MKQFAQLNAAAGRVYIAIGQYCWGKHANAKQAITNMKKEGSTDRFVLIDAPASATVSEFDGALCWKEADGDPIRVGLFSIRGKKLEEPTA